MPKNGGRRARRAAQERAELQDLRARRNPTGVVGGGPIQSNSEVPRCDWNCGLCRYNNYGSNAICRRCVASRMQGFNLHGVFRGRLGHVNALAGGFNVGRPTLGERQYLAQQGLQRVPQLQGPLVQPRLVGPQHDLPRHGYVRGDFVGQQPPSTQYAPQQRENRQSVREDPRQPAVPPRSLGPAAMAQSWADRDRGTPTERPGPHANTGGATQEVRQQDTVGGTNTSASLQNNNDRLDQVAREGDEDFPDAESHDDELHEEPSSWDLQKKMRSLEFARQRRERKLQKQQNEVEEQALYVEEQKRRLSSLQFAVDETKEDIRSIDEQSASVSKLLSELKAAQASAHEANDNDGNDGQEDEEGAAGLLELVSAAMRNFGSIRSPAIRHMLTVLAQQVQQMQAQFSLVAIPAASTLGRPPPPRRPVSSRSACGSANIDASTCGPCSPNNRAYASNVAGHGGSLGGRCNVGGPKEGR